MPCSAPGGVQQPASLHLSQAIFFSPRKPPKSYRRQLGEVLLKARPMAGAA